MFCQIFIQQYIPLTNKHKIVKNTAVKLNFVGPEETLAANCGIGCIIIGICLAGLFLLLALTGTVALWKACLRVKEKNRTHKYVPNWDTIQPAMSNQSETTLTLNGDADHPLQLHFQMNNTAVTPTYDTPKLMVCKEICLYLFYV